MEGSTHDAPRNSSLLSSEAAGVDEGFKIRSQALATDKKDLPEGYWLSPRFVGTFVGIAFVLTATYFQFQAAAAVSVSVINEDVGPSVNVGLFSTVWTISQPISMLLFGRLSDRFGRRGFALGSCCLGIIGGIVAATAHTMETLIGAEVLMGIASGIPAAYPLLTGELLTNKTKYLGTLLVVIPNIIATGFGPYLGQQLVHVANWRWIFYIYIILMVPGALLWFFFYFPPSYTQLHGHHVRKRDELKKLDFLGIFLLTAGLALFLLGVSWGGPTVPWNSPKIEGLLISGGICIVAFIVYEVFFPPERPIIPMRFFRDLRGFTCLEVVSSTFGVMNIALFIMWPQQIQYIFGSTLSSWQDTAWLGTSAAFGLWAGIVFLGAFFEKVKYIKYQILAASIWMTAFLGAMASITVTKKSEAIAFSFLAGLTIGWGEVVAMIVVQYIVSDADLGVAFSVISASRTIFGSIFTAAFIAIYTNKVPGKLQSEVVPAVQKAGLPASSITPLFTAITTGTQAALQAVPGMNTDILHTVNIAVSNAYSQSYAYVYYFAVALGGLAIIASLCLRDFDQYLTDHVSRQIYHKKDTNNDPLEAAETNHHQHMEKTASGGNTTQAATPEIPAEADEKV